MMPQYTPTQNKLMSVLQDGKPHSKAELRSVIDPEFPAEEMTLFAHIKNLRKCIPDNYLIITEYNRRRIFYRLAMRVPVGNE